MIGFQASDIGQIGIADFSWTSGSVFNRVGQSPPGGPSSGISPFFADNSLYASLGQTALTVISQILGQTIQGVPDSRAGPAPSSEGPLYPADAGPAPVESNEVLLPEWAYIPVGYETAQTVYESEQPQGIFADVPPVDWERAYEQYVEINQPEAPMWDWAVGQVTDLAGLGNELGFWGGTQQVQTQAYPNMGALAAPPAKVTVDTRTGKVTACKRRRRRKLLTESDFNVLLRVATLPSKENVRIVLGKAIGRS